MDSRAKEWLKQSDYDLETAKFMASGGRYFYSVFMCHLSIEKALKGLYEEKIDKIPPKTHNLILLMNKMNIKPKKKLGIFLVKLNEASITTRYPESLEEIQKNYTEDFVKEMVINTEEVLKWIRKQF